MEGLGICVPLWDDRSDSSARRMCRRTDTENTHAEDDRDDILTVDRSQTSGTPLKSWILFFFLKQLRNQNASRDSLGEDTFQDYYTR